MQNRLEMDDFLVPPILGKLNMTCLSSSNLGMYQQHVQERLPRLHGSKVPRVINFLNLALSETRIAYPQV